MKQSFLFEADNFGFRPVTENDLNYFQMVYAKSRYDLFRKEYYKRRRVRNL